MTKIHSIDLLTIDGSKLAAEIDKKYADNPDLAGFPLVATFMLTQDNTETLVLVFQKL
jgi:hypothetical protein